MKRLITIIFLVTLFGCSFNADTKLSCNCYKEVHLIDRKLVEKECNDGAVFGYSRESLMFNERKNTLNWGDLNYIGDERNADGDGTLTKLDFEKDSIKFSYRLVSRYRDVEEIKKNIQYRKLRFNRITLVAEETRGANFIAGQRTRYFQCELVEGV
jgi:hypothetical protein